MIRETGAFPGYQIAAVEIPARCQIYSGPRTSPGSLSDGTGRCAASEGTGKRRMGEGGASQKRAFNDAIVADVCALGAYRSALSGQVDVLVAHLGRLASFLRGRSVYRAHRQLVA